MKSMTPEARTAKANTRIAAAMSVFTKAADELDKAADEHGIASQVLLSQAEAADLRAANLRKKALAAHLDGQSVLLQAQAIRTTFTV